MSKRKTNLRVGRLEKLDERVVFSVEIFVDAVHGNDNNDGLSPTTAIRTLERVVSQYESLKPEGHIALKPGDSVVLMPGEHQFAYRYGEGQWQGLFLRNVHGTASQPITIRGVDGAVINNRAPDGSEMSSINILQSSHIVVENLEVTAYGSAITVADSSDVIVRDNYIHDVDGVAANNLSGVYLVGVRNVVVENNLLTDNYDRSRPGNANNRHIVIFGGVDVKILGNTMRNDNPNAGMAVDYKHLGGLTADQVGQYEVAYNTIFNAAGVAIGTAAPNSFIHHNLLVDSGGIKVADFGGTNQLADERIEYNTIVNNVDRMDGGGLSYYPNEYDGFPLGNLYWSHNFVVDNREYNHPEKSTIFVDRYGSDDFFQRTINGGLFHANGNVYQTRDPARFDLYGANGGRYGEFGADLTFAQWQALGYDVSGTVANINVDEFYRDRSSLSVNAGVYAGGGPRLSATMSQLDIDESGVNSTARLRIVRSGSDSSMASNVKISVSQADEISVPRQVVIPAGVDAIEVDIRGLADTKADTTEALQITLSADGFTEATTWIRLHDSPPSGPEDNSGESSSGIFQVPGNAGDRVQFQSTVAQRWAEYDNEMGIAYVDDAAGRVGNLLPSDAGWIEALMSRRQDTTVLRSGVMQGDIGQVELVAGRYFVFYLAQNSSTANWKEQNPTNTLGNGPLLFTSVTGSNPDLFDHVHESNRNDSIDLAWEDLEFGGDQSFMDLVVKNDFATLVSACQAVDDAFRISDGESVDLDVLVNDQLPSGAVIESFTQPEFGKVIRSEAGDKLLYQPESHRYGLVHFNYTVGSGNRSSTAGVLVEVVKSWTNVADAADVNLDGQVSPLDALLVITAIQEHGELVLPDYPDGDLTGLSKVDVNGDRRLTVSDALLVLVDLISQHLVATSIVD